MYNDTLQITEHDQYNNASYLHDKPSKTVNSIFLVIDDFTQKHFEKRKNVCMFCALVARWPQRENKQCSKCTDTK